MVKHERKWKLTPGEMTESFWDRADRLTSLRRVEKEQMQEYVSLEDGHMEFLIRALDGDPSHYQKPSLPILPATTNLELAQKAAAYLKRTYRAIEPRKRWPNGGLMELGLHGTIPIENRARTGRTLCVWGDAGWGKMVSDGKYRISHFPDSLVDAVYAMMAEMSPRPALDWVTCIPSTRHPELVPEFSRRLAGRLNLPFKIVLTCSVSQPEQKTMANSSQQARNVAESLTINELGIPSGPVLLIDDVVDSRWTLTIAAYLLTQHGAGPVFPLALAATINSG